MRCFAALCVRTNRIQPRTCTCKQKQVSVKKRKSYTDRHAYVTDVLQQTTIYCERQTFMFCRTGQSDLSKHSVDYLTDATCHIVSLFV